MCFVCLSPRREEGREQGSLEFVLSNLQSHTQSQFMGDGLIKMHPECVYPSNFDFGRPLVVLYTFSNTSLWIENFPVHIPSPEQRTESILITNSSWLFPFFIL
jgi:hypothetical protein